MKSSSKTTSSAPLYPVLLALMMGAFLVVYKLVLKWFPPFTTMALVMAGTSALTALLIACKHGTGGFRVGRSHMAFLSLLGFCGALLNNAIIWSVELASASNAALLVRSDLVFSALIGWIFYGENLTWRALSGLIILSSGAFLVLEVFPWELQVVSTGDVLALLAGLLLATNALIIKYGLMLVPDMVIAFYNTLMISLYSFAIVFLRNEISSLQPLLLLPALGLIFLAIVLSAGQFLCYYHSLHLFPIWIVRALLLLSPFVTLLLSQWILKEGVEWSQWIGGILLVAGGLILLRSLEKMHEQPVVQAGGKSPYYDTISRRSKLPRSKR